ncbi:2-hydroxyacid dehydrogenase [Pseudofrankia sp. BMG5.36]|uniref:2-hydroxyacid dehydrogenase n=1 Tax=Pseudofrankia sp. BMG5.36 TaxID=1834512 RepID=UPI0008D8E87D|nr:2-hydroxyacid dehydrogenase [Pseudofrankia sp. BMG5.36]OHV43451.1 hydroxyacid dehydrogenase [Pseudofrankia sp. BMG5.36]
MTVRVLSAGDDFVLNRLLADALVSKVPVPLDISEISLPWPVKPFGRVAEVDEASGTEEQMIEALRGVQICVTQMAPLTERILQASPELRLFCVGRGGPVNVNLDAATLHGVAITFAPGRNAQATAEHTVAMMLSGLRRIPGTHSDLMAGTWRGDYYRYESVGRELADSVVGLVGYGAIGSKVAGILSGFGVRVVFHDPYLTDVPVGAAESVSLEALLEQSHVVSLHARATPTTRGMIGAPQIAAMPQGSVLVNCARGSLLDYDAVCDALESGHLFAAAFDVFPEEPIPVGSRLRRTPNVIMTPHLAGASRETASNAADIIAADVARYLGDEPLLHCANPEVLPGKAHPDA